MDDESFGAVLRALRERAHLSQSAVARRAGLDPSFVNRLESGQRNAERSIAERLARALELEPADADRLLLAGGHLPTVFARIGPRDPTLQTVVRILGDESLSPGERDDFREVIRLIGARWLRHGTNGPNPAAPATEISPSPDVVILPEDTDPEIG